MLQSDSTDPPSSAGWLAGGGGSAARDDGPLAPILAPPAGSFLGSVSADGCDRPPASATRSGVRSTATRSGLTDRGGGTGVLGDRVFAATGGAHDGPRRTTRLLLSVVTTLPPVSFTPDAPAIGGCTAKPTDRWSQSVSKRIIYYDKP